ncbi:restriction endonuclease subunit S [Sphingobacterium lactis]|uniref:restriction endonuclease subunit S n=1 Tax=Sphingobacterium lactis TaxID=797291 RepID=UPI003F81798D
MEIRNPELRFKNANCTWERKCLSEIANRFDNLRIPVKASEREIGEIPYYGANGIQSFVNGFTHEGEFVLLAEDGANDLKNYPIQYVEGKIWVNNHAHVIQGINTNNRFLANALKQVNFEKFLVGGGRAKLNSNIMMDIEITISSDYKEQTQIGNFFKSLDEKIALLEQKHEKLVQLKKAMLDKMFPKPEAKVPEIRFRGFSGDWEEDLMDLHMDFNLPTNSYSRAMLNDNEGTVKNIHYGDILVRYSSILSVKDTKIPFVSGVNKSDFKSQLLCEGDVIFADAAEDNAVGKAIEIVDLGDDYVVSGLHTIVARPLIPFSKCFLGYYINSKSYHDQLLCLMQGTKVLSISKTSLKKTTLKFPKSNDEQQKIGEYFEKLDKLIAKSTVLIDKFKNIKQALLSKMFV